MKKALSKKSISQTASGEYRGLIGGIAELLEVSEEQVNVKATTTERLGFLGRGEGIAAQAVVLLIAA